MSASTLTQSRLWATRRYRLAAEGVEVVEKSWIGYVHSEQPLALWVARPDEGAVRTFLEAMKGARAEFMEARVGAVAGVAPIDTLERLAALRSSGALTDDEYDRLKAIAIDAIAPAESEVASGQYL